MYLYEAVPIALRKVLPDGDARLLLSQVQTYRMTSVHL